MLASLHSSIGWDVVEHSLHQICQFSAVHGRVSNACVIHSCIVSSQSFLWWLVSLLLPFSYPSLTLQDALQGGFGVMLGGVAKPGELSSSHHWQGIMLSSKGIHLLSHVVVCFVFGVRNAVVSPEAFNFKCLYSYL